ncbi:U3-containing 90S pre-ribosomal complex subunit-domain containing protein [Crucibulum laeve]|uniref:U3-containing 90S pre-ribosomal complex subunit-domain containing protein n=1 Tax=Crucibulum laeve TaxID=68775 RepID=A0A5C3MDR4_9AGAR|nr:U3-containing 90S pre-ribosomal complex subunit-domain containing protein [Crucibulum laeve]
MSIKQGGDDLEDDFVLDDIVALSEEEDEIEDEAFFSDAPEDAVQPQDEEHLDAKDEPEPSPIIDEATVAKKRKRREKEKERRAKKRKLTEEAGGDVVHCTIAARSPSALSDFLCSMQTKTFSKLSAIELGDMRIPETSIADTTAWTGPRTLDHLVEFIVTVLPTLKTRLAQKSRHNGSPTVLFVAGAALRVADITRVLKDKRLRGEKGGEVAKLFAKHFKLAEHVTYLKQTKVGSAVGTPGRIGKLLCETDALTVSALTHIILDATFVDPKNRSLFDIPETRDEVFKTVLGGPQVLKAIQDGKIQVVLF